MVSKLISLFFIAFLILISGCTTPELPVCGNGVCETGEYSETCPLDCGSSDINTETYSVGQSISNLQGRGILQGQNVKIVLKAVVSSGSSQQYNATLELYDQQGAVVDVQTVSVGAKLETWFKNNTGVGAPLVLKTPINVRMIYVDSETLVGKIDIIRTPVPAPYCGDFTCDAGETSANCQADCGYPVDAN